MEFITWLNSNSGAIIAFATVVLTVITWRYVRLTKDYVRLTRQALEENRQMRLDAQKPQIAIYLVHCQTIFAIFMLLCYHWIPIYLLVQIQLTLMEWSIQCVSKNIK